MATRDKIAVSLPRHLVRHVRAAVSEGRADSASAYVAEALEQRRRDEDLAVLLDEMLAETGGPLTEAERATADALLDGGDG